jgi:UMF1 family MFS transporter
MALTLPMLLYFKERSKPVKAEGFHIAEEVKNLAHHFRGLKRFPGVIRFLFAMFFFNDAVLTAADNFPIYIHRVFNVNEQAKVFLLASVLIMTGVGAIASGYIVPQGGKKKLLLVLLASWVVLLPITALQKHLIPFIICMTLVGLLLGATGAVARTVMIYLSPREELTHIFAYYSMTARLASFLGPLTWGLITLAFRGHGHVKYQVALAAMAVFVWIGYLLVRSIPEENELQAI